MTCNRQSFLFDHRQTYMWCDRASKSTNILLPLSCMFLHHQRTSYTYCYWMSKGFLLFLKAGEITTISYKPHQLYFNHNRILNSSSQRHWKEAEQESRHKMGRKHHKAPIACEESTAAKLPRKIFHNKTEPDSLMQHSIFHPTKSIDQLEKQKTKVAAKFEPCQRSEHLHQYNQRRIKKIPWK